MFAVLQGDEVQRVVADLYQQVVDHDSGGGVVSIQYLMHELSGPIQCFASEAAKRLEVVAGAPSARRLIYQAGALPQLVTVRLCSVQVWQLAHERQY
jgi:hypothetical protein